MLSTLLRWTGGGRGRHLWCAVAALSDNLTGIDAPLMIPAIDNGETEIRLISVDFTLPTCGNHRAAIEKYTTPILASFAANFAEFNTKLHHGTVCYDKSRA